MHANCKQAEPDISKKFTSECYLLLYNILWTFTRKVYFVLGQNGPWQNIMHIYVYEDDEEQGGGATWPVATIIIYRHILAFCIEIHRYHF